MRITLTGSTRFMDQYNAWNRWLTLRGLVVYSVATSVKHDFVPTDDEKETLDLVHLLKIYNSEAVLVIDCTRMPLDISDVQITDAYIGDSTRREIKWAKMLGKAVEYTSWAKHNLY